VRHVVTPVRSVINNAHDLGHCARFASRATPKRSESHRISSAVGKAGSRRRQEAGNGCSNSASTRRGVTLHWPCSCS
jgi:hypothetical protein